MDIEILEEFYNPLLDRREIRFQVKHPGSATPDRFKVRQALRERFNVDLDRVFILRLVTKTGMNVSEGICHIYENPENVKYLLPRHIYIKNLSPEERSKFKEAR